MGAYILRRLLLMIPTILGIMLITFAIVQFAPGGPVEQVLAQLSGQGGSARTGEPETGELSVTDSLGNARQRSLDGLIDAYA